MTFLPSMPQASLLEIFKAYPEFAHPIHEFAHTLMRGESPFSPAERELIAAYVSSLNGCDFCQQSHAATAERFGVSQDLLAPLLRGESDPTPLSDKLRAVLRYVRVLNDIPPIE